jgi:hypothetical protein
MDRMNAISPVEFMERKRESISTIGSTTGPSEILEVIESW